MQRVFTIAVREFLVVVLTKAFLLGIILPPVLMTVALGALPLLMNSQPPAVSGHIAVIDRSGVVAPLLAEAFTEEKIRERREMEEKDIKEGVKDSVDKLNLDPKLAEQAQKSIANNPAPAMAKPAIPMLRVTTLPSDADPETAKVEILKSTGRETDTTQDRRLALVVIPQGAVTRPISSQLLSHDRKPTVVAYDKFQLFTAPRLDVEVQQDIRNQAARAIVDARLAGARYDVPMVRDLLEKPESDSMAVTSEGDRSSNPVAKMLVPGAFMFLLWISVFTAGQNLLTSTIEEKSSRVMEVLLSAVSPMQLMMGKVLGKGAVGLLILVLYSAVGGGVLVALAMSHILEWENLVYLIVYFLIAYFTIASLFAAVGAAVTEVAEAQSLIGPIMIILIIPMMLWMPILRNPNSTFAQVCSFVPLINPFVMVLRISGSEPIPVWQIPASIVIGLVTVVVLIWAASKIFRIGVLMYGKPPNFATLIRWVRMA